MKLFRWISGRQHDGAYPYYFKIKLASGKNWDFYLLRFNVECFIGYHTDHVKKGYKHYRLNIYLWEKYDSFHINPMDGKPLFNWWRFILFRPDIQRHGLGVIKSKILMLSIGWIRKKE